MSVRKDRTTIQLKPETKERLRKLGEKGMSYDAIINKLLYEAEKLDEIRRNAKKLRELWESEMALNEEKVDALLDQILQTQIKN